jgi:histidine triad (HIT) family protein
MPQQQEQCPFCHFIQNQPDQLWIIDETENFYAWLEYPEPRAKGQTNIVPKEHTESVLEFSPEKWNEATNLLRRVMERAERGLDADGMSVTMNVKEAAGQMVPHAYIQVFPRFQEDENAGTPTGAIFPKREDLQSESVFEEIESGMKSIDVEFGAEEIDPHPESQKFKEDQNKNDSDEEPDNETDSTVKEDDKESAAEKSYRKRGESVRWN